ncbi:hypothetical protein ACIBCA_29635 [Kitasatospora sp. NPDC051170]|uniref:hypothetical protein n=1 Tax=Kitasatospora sp. NPDC051170 TaxID=3364056 RepID=UPI0037A1F8DC
MRFELLNPNSAYPRATLVDPPPNGYLHLAGAVAPPSGPPLVRTVPARSALLDRLKPLATALQGHPAVRRVTVYRALVVPPAGGYARQPQFHQARFDVAVLVETDTPEDLGPVTGGEAYGELRATLTAAASDTHELRARCTRSLGAVDHSRAGLFLFNHFVAEDRAVALELWDHLAGWYVRKTGLDNSTLLEPLDGTDSDYVFVNHARWDTSALGLLLRQVSRPSFRGYVQQNLLVNRVGTMPVLYRMT